MFNGSPAFTLNETGDIFPLTFKRDIFDHYCENSVLFMVVKHKEVDAFTDTLTRTEFFELQLWLSKRVLLHEKPATCGSIHADGGECV